MTKRAVTGRPVIGIAGAAYDVPRPWGQMAVSGASTAAVAAIAAAGGLPVILPISTAGHNEALDRLDALVLAGGGDLDPRLYGSTTARALDVDRKRDTCEVALLHEAFRRRLPLLGLCRGLQLMAVGFGGSLTVHLGDHNPHVILDGGHVVVTSPGSVSRRLLGDRAIVNSLHHQAVLDPGEGFHVTATAEDGVVEAIEWQGADWHALGVQWHPELSPEDGTSKAVFGWLVEMGSRRTKVWA